MAGIKGRSGGSRANTGGARSGAGRPPVAPAMLPAMPATSDPLEFLRQVMSNPETEARLRIGAAAAQMPYVHGKVGETGKKAEKREAAEKAASGKFASTKPPVRLMK